MADDLAPIEQEVHNLLDQAQANLDAAETHGSHGRGVADVWVALQNVARRLAEEVAYKADLSDVEERLSALEGTQTPAIPLDVQQTFLALVQAWWAWAPSLVATGDPGLARFVEEFGRQVEAHARAMLPSAMGLDPEQVDAHLKASPPFVPALPAPGTNGQAPAPTAAG